ncbi:MAG: hypothetical protein ABEJ92_08145 [Halobacteriales archaeon]
MSAVPPVRRWQRWSTAGIVVLGAAATLSGLLVEGFYRDPAALRVQAYGQDLVTLAVVLPALLVGYRYATRGSLRGVLLWLGSLGYTTYTYAVYAVITEFNPFFLGYVALFGLSLFTFVAGLLAVDAEAVAARVDDRLPVRPVAGYFAAMGAVVALLWLAEVVPATLAGTKPESVAAVGLPANVVHVLDLGVVIPAVFLTAWWLVSGRAWGAVLAGVLFVKLVAIGLAVLGMLAWMAAAGQAVAPAEVAVFSAVTLVGIGVGVVYFRALGPPPASSGTRRAPNRPIADR